MADWCERLIKCNYEENLEQTDIIPRWFEAGSGTKLFSIIRDPIDYYEYTGRRQTISGAKDGGGRKYIK
eukprot:7102918-Ditylum_brightwellii.AAC.1